MSARAIHLVCSDAPRNGKTLLARLLADCLLLDGHDLLLLDGAGPQPAISLHYPGHARLLDLARTQGMVSLFDDMLQAGKTCVVDLPARHVDAFFSLLEDGMFLKEASARALAFHAYFIIDRDAASFRKARAIWHASGANFMPVRNEWLGSYADEPQVELNYQEMSEAGELLIPALPAPALRWLAASGNDFRKVADYAPRMGLRPPSELFVFLRQMAGQLAETGRL